MTWSKLLEEASRAVGLLIVVFGLIWTVGSLAAEDFVEDVVDEKLEQRIKTLENSLSEIKINDGSRKEQLKHISKEQDEIKQLLLRALTERRN